MNTSNILRRGMKAIPLLILLVMLECSNTVYSQDVLFHHTYFPKGISVSYGIGNFVVRDDFLTNERYSGPMPFFSAGWTTYADSTGFRVLFSIHNSSEIRNKNMTADVLNFSLAWDYFNHIKTFQLFSRGWRVFAGPSAELFIYSNRQDYATSGIYLDLSFASMISLGANVGLCVPLNDRIVAESGVRTNIFSLGIRMPLVNDVDGAENDQSRLKLLTALTAINVHFDAGVRYFLFQDLSLKAAYRFQLTDIVVWEKLISSSDHFILSLSYGL